MIIEKSAHLHGEVQFRDAALAQIPFLETFAEDGYFTIKLFCSLLKPNHHL